MRFALLLLALMMFGCAGNTVAQNCEIKYDGQCYTDAKSACTAAGCPDDCLILETYPGQVSCQPKTDAKTTDADKPVSSTKPVLFVVSGHTELGNTGKKTGYFLSEVAHPWHVLTKAGVGVSFVSPNGGAVEMDPKSNDLEDPINVEFLASDDAKKLANTMKPADVDATQFSAIFYAGGHGAMWDFPSNPKLAETAATIYENGGVVAAVCHGPAGLVDIKLSDGTFLVAGKKVAAFTNEEEAAVELTNTVPFLLADKLKERGAIHVPAENFEANVVVDARLVTGQNPASATGVGEKILEIVQHGEQVSSDTSANTDIDGESASLDKSAIGEVIRKNSSQISYCYEKELYNDPKKPQGRIDVEFTIDAQGSVVSSVTKESNLGSEAMEACIHQRIRKWTFPKLATKKFMVIRLPIDFRLSAKDPAQTPATPTEESTTK
ncbi:MAG: AgmX/PglI C-terminal domain-containing protein [bacterium]